MPVHKVVVGGEDADVVAGQPIHKPEQPADPSGQLIDAPAEAGHGAGHHSGEGGAFVEQGGGVATGHDELTHDLFVGIQLGLEVVVPPGLVPCLKLLKLGWQRGVELLGVDEHSKLVDGVDVLRVVAELLGH